MSLIENGNSVTYRNPACFDAVKQLRGACCIQTPVILSQIKMRECVTRNIALSPGPENDRPSFSLKGTDGFKIVELRVLAEDPVKVHADKKRVDLFIVIRYNLIYSDGLRDLVQPDDACFELSIDNIKCPESAAKLFQKGRSQNQSSESFKEKAYFTADALAEVFGDVICPYTGALIIDLGVFFIIRSECIMELSVPTFPDCIPHTEQKEKEKLPLR